MDELHILTKGSCDKCRKGGRWLTVLPREDSYAASVAEELEEGYRLCLDCIYTLQKEAALLRRLVPPPPQAPTKATKKKGKKGTKKVSTVTASSGGEG